MTPADRRRHSGYMEAGCDIEAARGFVAALRTETNKSEVRQYLKFARKRLEAVRLFVGLELHRIRAAQKKAGAK